MLLALSLENFALVEKAEINFSKGLNVLTGETGAGKSILIDALHLCLGSRASIGYVRSGCQSARVRALFDMSDLKQVVEILETQGISLDESSSLLIDREIMITGRNVIRVNGQLATVSMIKRIGHYLVDFHGQMDNALLLNIDFHRSIIDSYGGASLASIKDKLNTYLARLRNLERELSSLGNDSQSMARELDLLRYQSEEIAAAKLKTGEEEELLSQRMILRNMEKIHNFIDAVDDLLSGTTSSASVLEQLGDIGNTAEELAKIDPKLHVIVDLINTSYYQLEEVSRSTQGYKDSIDFECGELDLVEERLYEIGKLKRKYGETIDSVIEYKKTLLDRINLLENSEGHRISLQNEIDSIKKEYISQARSLSAERINVGKRLAKELCIQLHDLGMPHARVECHVIFDEKKMTEEGSDNVEFYFSGNKGEPMKPLTRVASGGELSRFALAMKAITIDATEGAQCVVFDEIDVGIGGLVAKAVAQKLCLLAKKSQVLCITHQAIIGSKGSAHIKVNKKEHDNRTITEFVTLNGQERLQEIIRMLGGISNDRIAREHAKKLLKELT